jgi:acyl-CoA dehydrogenase
MMEPHMYVWISIVAIVVLILIVPPIRTLLFGKLLLNIMRKMLPTIGDTERIALEAGTVWWDKELFSGKPNWKKMMNFHIKSLTKEEQAFVDGPVEELCRMSDDWKINQQWDLTPEIWKFLKDKGFFGMIIPKNYGGLGFSAQAHSAVITKIGSRSTSVAVTVMVPNSLGPAELLLHYGTEEQKNYYLPRLARGEEIPCFALTEPTAGSDASSIRSTGIVCKGKFEGQEVLGLRLNWDKRWITLSPVATLIGLAFQMKDPDHLLGVEDEIGITCALVPANLTGIDIGKRHNPLHSSFQNGPTRGHDVFVPLSYIIGGQKMAGQGWRMLMECLAAGRSISLPAMACGNSKLAIRTIAAHGKIREQFNTPIGKFEGIEERVTHMTGLMYICDASRKLTAGAVDDGEKPSVVSAIMKAYITENARQIINDAMDIRAGAGITLGPKNPLGNVYMSIPISITVEGANILTRTLIIFGQGAIRCHPFIQDELKAIDENNVKNFDRAFFGHIFHVIKNAFRTLFHGLTGAHLACGYGSGDQRRILQKLSRISAAYAFLSDTAMGVLGGALKRKEKISGRLADILAWQYLAAACVKKFIDDGKRKEDLPFLVWTTDYCLYGIQRAFYGVFQNFQPGILGWTLKKMVFPFGSPFRIPTDIQGRELSIALFDDQNIKDRLTEGMFIPKNEPEGLGWMEATLDQMKICEPISQKLKLAISKKLLSRHSERLLEDAVDSKIITPEEKNQMVHMEEMKHKAIQVDEFSKDYFSHEK